MSPALRFLGLAVVGWVGLRAAMLGALPGGELFHFGSAPTTAPPIVATEFPPLEPLAPAQNPWLAASGAPPYAYYPDPPPPRIYYVSAPSSAAYREAGWPHYSAPLVRPVAPAFYAAVPVLDEWPLSRLAAASSSPSGWPRSWRKASRRQPPEPPPNSTGSS